jgi:hypothetical protein
VGWSSSLQGQADEVVEKEINRDYTIHTSLLRNKEGFIEESLNKYQDGFLRSTFTKYNHSYENFTAPEKSVPYTGEDGSTLVFDARVTYNSMGKPNERRLINSAFRSVYEMYSAGGEPMMNSLYPKIKGQQIADTIDHLCYAQHSGLVLYRYLTLPHFLSLKKGETPDESLTREDFTFTAPFPSMKYNFNYRLDQLREKIMKNYNKDNDEENEGGVGLSSNIGGGRDKEIINQMKRSLKDILKKQDEMISIVVENGPSLSRQLSSSSERKDENEINIPQPEKKIQVSGVWGGKWGSFTSQNFLRLNYYLPNAVYGSSHVALGAEFIFDESLLNSKLN